VGTLPKQPRFPDFEEAKNLEELKQLCTEFKQEFEQLYNQIVNDLNMLEIDSVVFVDPTGQYEPWRFKKVGDNFELQKEVSGTWTTAHTWFG
jgi:hypothetical protein